MSNLKGLTLNVEIEGIPSGALSFLNMVEVEEGDITILIDADKHKDSYYTLLGLPYTSNSEEVVLAVKRSLSECHPDRFSDADETVLKEMEERTQKLNEVRNTFRGDGGKEKYDKSLGYTVLSADNAQKLIAAVYSGQFMNYLEGQTELSDVLSEEIRCRDYLSGNSPEEDGISLERKGFLSSRLKDEPMVSESAHTEITEFGEFFYSGMLKILESMRHSSTTRLKGSISLISNARLVRGLLDDVNESGMIDGVYEDVYESLIESAQDAWMDGAKAKHALDYFRKNFTPGVFTLSSDVTVGVEKTEEGFMLRRNERVHDPEPSPERSKFREEWEVEEKWLG